MSASRERRSIRGGIAGRAEVQASSVSVPQLAQTQRRRLVRMVWKSGIGVLLSVCPNRVATPYMGLSRSRA